MAIPFIASHVSGVTLQDDVSSAVPRSYIDLISSNIDTRIDSLEASSDTPDSWTTLTAGTGFEAFEGEIGVSGSTPVSLDIAGYSTISSNAQWAQNWLSQSGSRLSDYLGSGEEYTAAYDWYVASAQKLSIVNASGNEYSAAYASAQASKAHAYHAKISSAYLAQASGYDLITDDDTIAHGLGAKPTAHSVTPSGLVTFAIASTVDATNINVRISAPGTRGVNWWAQL